MNALSALCIQSLTSPKNVIIMIDNTGSVVGLTLSLIKDTVNYLMNTLTQYDFFNVVSFNNDVNFLYDRDGFSCRRLIQATPRNKEVFCVLLIITMLNIVGTFRGTFLA